MTTKVFNKSEVSLAIHEVAKRISHVMNNVSNEIVTFNDKGTSVCTRFQLLFNLKFGSVLQKSIYDIILEHAFVAEQMGPGSFDKCIQTTVDSLVSNDDEESIENVKQSLSEILGHGAAIPSETDIDWLINKYSGNVSGSVVQMIKESIFLAGFAGRVVVERSASFKPSVELIRGYTFSANPAFPLTRKFSNPRIVAVDGFIEGVHEINALLEDAVSMKESVILFVRGLHDDVMNTLKVNYDRRTLIVIPVIVKFDFEGINTLVDVAMTSGADLKSTAKGDTFGSVKLIDAPIIETASVYADQVVLSNNKTSVAVHNHVVGLRKRRLLENEDTVANLFDKRIKSLSPNHVVLRIPDDQNYVKNSQSIDYVLRAYKSLLSHGTIEFDGEKQLTSKAAASYIHAMHCLKTIRDLGAVII